MEIYPKRRLNIDDFQKHHNLYEKILNHNLAIKYLGGIMKLVAYGIKDLFI